MVLGAATERRLFGVLEAKRAAQSVAVTTEDGSVGTTGRVTDVLPELLARTGAAVVYACGPMGMLRAVAGLAAEHGVWSQCAVEESMACGVGVCMTCVLPVRGDDGTGAHGALVRRGPGLPRRPGAVGRRRHGAGGHARRAAGGDRAMTVVEPADRRRSPRVATVDLAVVLAGAHLPTPVMTASGCAAAGRELSPFLDLAGIGAVVTKSVMLDPRSGRPTPRMVETPSGMLNSIGLQGPGIDAFLATDLPWLVSRGARAVVSIAGGSLGEYAELGRRVGASPGVTAVEVNISCPNVEDRGLVFACDPFQAARAVSAVRRGVPRDVPLLAKLSPDVTDIVTVAESVMEAGADGLTMINTTLGLAIDPDTLRPVLAASPAACPGRRSARSRCAASGRCTRPCPTCRSSAWAACAPAGTHWSSCWPARVPSRSAPWCSTTRRHRTGSPRSCATSCPAAGSPRPPTSWAWPTDHLHRPRREENRGRAEPVASRRLRGSGSTPRSAPAARSASASTRTPACWPGGA